FFSFFKILHRILDKIINLLIADTYCFVKKLVAISLLCLHLFSLYGHLALYEYFVYQSDQHFNEQISMNKYAVDDLNLVKVPVNMPTLENWQDFACVSGV